MNNLKSLLCLSLIAGGLSANAQVSVNSISTSRASSPKFIHSIAFTPSGITAEEYIKPASEPKPVFIESSKGSAGETDQTEMIEECGSVQFKYAMLVDVPVETLTQSTIYSYIDEWMGTRYRMGGTTRKGIDCSALSGHILQSCFSLSVPRTAREQFKASIPVEREDLTEGDLVFFNTTGGVSHVGVYLANDYFVHASSSQGVTISNLNESYFEKRFIRGGRITTCCEQEEEN